MLFPCAGAAGLPNVIYKPVRPPGDLNTPQLEAMPPSDLKNLPDPFLSYLVRKVIQDSALKEQQDKKRREEEKKRARMKAAAEEKLRQLRKPKTILQKLNLHQLLLTAIIESPKGGCAMVRDEKGMGYVLEKGTAIGTKGGRVSKISWTQGKVIVKEPYLEDIYIKYRTVVIELPDKES
jgi:Tfp pilus assembly protein PilP